MSFEQYSAGMAWITTSWEAAHGPGSAAILPPGFLQMILTLLMSLLGGACPTPVPPAPTPTPAAIKAAAAANVGYIQAKLMMAMGWSAWRAHGRLTMAAVMPGIAVLDESPSGVFASCISSAE